MSRKSILVILSIFFISIFFACFGVKATLVPQVYFTELNIQKNSFEPGEIIKGSVSLWNYEDFVINDLIFYFQLLGEEVNGVPSQMVDEQIGKEIFSLLPGEKTAKAFSYTLPANLPKGDFKFRIQLANTRGEEMSWMDKIITIGGENKFLTLDNYWIVKDGEDLAPGGGVRYQPGEIPEIRFDVKNNSSFTITAFSKIFTYKRNVGEILREEKGEAVILKPGEVKTQQSFLPELTKPESYLSEVRFFDTDSQEPISNSIYFRWIISGEDAEILFVNLDKPSYEAGEEAEVEVQIAGPPDYEIPGGEGTVEVELFNQEGELVGEGEKEVELDSEKVTVDVLLEEDVDNPRVEVKVIKDGEVLDEYNSYVAPVEKGEEEKKLGFFERNKKLLIFTLVSILIIIAFIIYYLKTRKRKKPLFLILLVLFGGYFLFFGADKVLAATEVTGGKCDTTVIWNSPPPDQVYNIGDVVNFSGKFRVTGCGDGLFYNRVDFFITDDIKPKKPPLVKAGDECCLNCLGATSDIYGPCANIQNLQWCDALERLDESQPNVYKLGTIFPPDIGSGATPYWVEYNQSFTIPSDLGFLGPVRFYGQYSGTHWKAHWHWNITYQKGLINPPRNQPPYITNAVILYQNYCVASPKGHIEFNWTYNDNEGDRQEEFNLQIATDSSFTSDVIVVDSPPIKLNKGPGEIGTTGVDVLRDPTPAIEDLDIGYGDIYYWRIKVRARDENLDWSGWAPSSSGGEFNTSSHPWPDPSFYPDPEKPEVADEVTFVDESICYTAIGEYNCKERAITSYAWDFDYKPVEGFTTEPDTTKPNAVPVTNTYLEAEEYRVGLKVTDDQGTCLEDITLTAEPLLSLPKWKEIIPF